MRWLLALLLLMLPLAALAMARISQTLIRQISAMAAYSAISANTNRLIQALGTWM